MSKYRRLIEIVALAVCLVMSCVLLHHSYRKYLRTCYPNPFEELVLSCAEEYRFDPSLLMALIYTESHFEAEAQSSVGAKGLMQLMDSTFEWAQIRLETPEDARLDPVQLYDPAVNIRYGSYVLYLLREEFTTEDTVLAAYNAGIGTVREWLQDTAYSDDGKSLRKIPYPETNDYVKRVRAAQDMYRRLYAYS